MGWRVTFDLSELGPAVLAPGRRSSSTATGTHLVHIYDDDSELIESLTRFISIGYLTGGPAIVLATEAHRDALAETLEEEGHDLTALAATGRYRSLNADDIVAQVTAEGVPKKARFSKVIGGLVEEASVGGRKVRIFGELVTLLMERGNVAGAVRLEELWNEQAVTHAFRLYCGYPAELFGADTVPLLKEVCRQHTHVVLPGV